MTEKNSARMKPLTLKQRKAAVNYTGQRIFSRRCPRRGAVRFTESIRCENCIYGAEYNRIGVAEFCGNCTSLDCRVAASAICDNFEYAIILRRIDDEYTRVEAVPVRNGQSPR